jgi:membrane-associated protease RseP (regulator of RpoE activity)
MTTLAYSISAYALNPSFFEALVKKGNVKVLTSCIPVFLGVVSIQVLHEVAHYFVAKRRRMKIGRPIPLLSPMLGLYGCITQLKSFPKNRSELLDFSLSGPFAAIVASLACIYSGIFLTVRATPGALAKFPVVSVAMLKSSFLVGSLLSWLASKTLMLPLSQPVPIHPLFFIGYSGLIASALNLLPIFRLDGGRAFSAAMGSQQTVIISISALLLMMSHSLSKGTGIGFLWGIFILAFQRREEVPARDEVTKIDNFRFCICVFSYILSITILTPFPGFRGVL